MIVLLSIIAIFSFGMAIWKFNEENKEKKQEEEIIQKKKELEEEYHNIILKHITQMKNNYDSLRNQLTIPDNCDKIDISTTVFGLPCEAKAGSGILSLLQNDFYIWTEENTLFIFPTEEHLTEKHISYRTLAKDLEAKINENNIKIFKIPKSNIDYFKICGEKRSRTINYAKPDSGVNIKGAVVGGILAGDAGAIIGSQYKNPNNAPTSKTINYDDRFVELYYRESDKVERLLLSITSYPLLEKWFPDKTYEYTMTQTNEQQQNHTKNEAFNEIKKFKELLDSNIITQEEFEKKKKELLNL